VCVDNLTSLCCGCCRNQANELLACVDNVNLASRLVHLHLDREKSVVGVTTTIETENMELKSKNCVEFEVFVDPLIKARDEDLLCRGSCDVIKPDSSSSGVEEGSNISSAPDGAVFDEVIEYECCMLAADCRRCSNGGHQRYTNERLKSEEWKQVSSDLEDDCSNGGHQRYTNERLKSEEWKQVSSVLEDDWSGFGGCNINISLSIFTDVSSVSCAMDKESHIGSNEDIFHMDLNAHRPC